MVRRSFPFVCVGLRDDAADCCDESAKRVHSLKNYHRGHLREFVSGPTDLRAITNSGSKIYAAPGVPSDPEL
jgi:hypothetical protein